METEQTMVGNKTMTWQINYFPFSSAKKKQKSWLADKNDK